ncbi:MAG: hypothetical protein MJ145_01340 [Clostridia bacterium]|nr:hypothetical protein [Clostridia bacterium]
MGVSKFQLIISVAIILVGVALKKYDMGTAGTIVIICGVGLYILFILFNNTIKKAQAEEAAKIEAQKYNPNRVFEEYGRKVPGTEIELLDRDTALDRTDEDLAYAKQLYQEHISNIAVIDEDRERFSFYLIDDDKDVNYLSDEFCTSVCWNCYEKIKEYREKLREQFDKAETLQAGEEMEYVSYIKTYKYYVISLHQMMESIVYMAALYNEKIKEREESGEDFDE